MMNRLNVAEESKAAGFVLVGGKSRRMGCDKALLEYKGRPLWLGAVSLLTPFVASVTLLGPPERYGSLGMPVLPDLIAQGGPLVAILTALESTSSRWNIFLACDLPWIDPGVISLLLSRSERNGCEAVVARTSDGWQPLCAIYQRACLPKIRQALKKGRTGVVSVLPELCLDVITTEQLEAAGLSERMFVNVNDRETWERVAGCSR